MKKEQIYYDNNWISVLALEPGEEYKIQTNMPLLGVKGFLGANVQEFDSSDNPLSYPLMDYYYTFSKDGLVWDEEKNLILNGVSGIENYREKHPCQINFRVKNNRDYLCKLGNIHVVFYMDTQYQYNRHWLNENTTRIPTKSSLDFKYPIYKKSFPNDELFTRDSLLWSINVLKKMFSRGIVPDYIERSDNHLWTDKTYIDFWCWVTLLSSLFPYYHNKFKDLNYDKELLSLYLTQRGLTATSDDLGELFYLASNYYNEMRTRGTPLVFQSNIALPDHYIKKNYSIIGKDPDNESVIVRGELLRVLGLNNMDNFEQIKIKDNYTGWWVGETCPNYSSTTNIPTTTYKYENSDDYQNLFGSNRFSIGDIGNYPILKQGTTDVRVMDDILLGITNPIKHRVLYLSDTNNVFFGLGYSPIGLVPKSIQDYYIRINPLNSYEITFAFRNEGQKNISFGVRSFDSLGFEITYPFIVGGGTDKSMWFFEERHSMRDMSGEPMYTFVRGILFGTLINPLKLNNYAVLNTGYGNNLQIMSEGVKLILPVIYCKGPDKVCISDFRVRKLEISPADFLGEDYILINEPVNSDIIRDEENKRIFINKYLLPYESNLTIRHYNDYLYR